MSSPDRLAEIFRRVIQAPPAERQVILERECGGDPELRREIEELLRCDSIEPTGASRHPLDGPPLVAAESVEAVLSEDHSSEGADCHPAGTIIDGQFRVVRSIGRGGSGSVVYLVEQLDLGRRSVALKILETALLSPRVAQRFDEECRALADLSHPGIAKIYSSGRTAEQRRYFVMEFLSRQNGEPALSITKYAREEHLSPRERIEIFLLVCDAVQHAHQKRIVHGDLKPSNLLVEEREGRAQPKVIDFGIAKNLDLEEEPTRNDRSTIRTLSREISGTPAYMSPEQAAGLRIDIRSDIYSLGVVLYELLCGRVPIETEGLGILEALRATLESEPLAPSHVAKRVATEADNEARTEWRRLSRVLRGDLDTVILRSLEKNPERRFASVGAFAEELQRFLTGQPIESRRRTLVYTLGKLVRRHRAFAAAVAVVFVALAASTILSLVLLNIADGERTRAATMATIAAGARTVAEEMATLANLRNAQHALENEEGNDLRLYLAEVPEERRGWEWSYLGTVSDRSSRRIECSSSPVSALALDGQGKRLLCGDRGGVASLWNFPSLEPLPARVLHEGEPGVRDVWSVAWSPDGRSFATSSFNGTVNLCSAESGAILSVISSVQDRKAPEVYAVAFSPDQRWLFVGTGRFRDDYTKSTLAAYRTSDGEFLWRDDQHKHSAPISDLAVSRDGRWLASASDDARVRLWNLDGGLPVHTGDFTASDQVNAVAFSPNARWLAIGTYAPEVAIYPLEQGRVSAEVPVIQLKGHQQPLASVAFHPDGVHLASGAWDTTIRIWALPQEDAIDVLCGHRGRVNRVIFTQDGQLLSSSNDGSVRNWGKLPVPSSHRMLEISSGAIEQIEFLADGTMAVACTSRGLRVLDPRTGELCSTLDARGCAAFAISPDASKVAWTRPDAVRTWQRGLGATADPYPAGVSEHGGSAISFLDDEHLVCAGESGMFSLGLWTHEWHRLSDIPPIAPGSTLDCTLQVRASAPLQSFWTELDERCRVFGDRPQAIAKERLYFVSASSHAAYVFYAEVGRHTLIVYDAERGTVGVRLSGHTEKVGSLAITRDQTRLASVGEENMLRIWDWRGGKQTLALRHPDSKRQVPGVRGPRFTAVAWSHDGRTLVTGSTNGVVHFWPSQREAAR